MDNFYLEEDIMKVKSVPWKLKDMTPYRKHVSKLKQCDKDIVFITFGMYTNKFYSI